MASRYTSRQTRVRFEAGGGVGLDIGPGPGNLTVGEVRQGNVTIQKVRNRGAHDGFVQIEDMVQECALEIELLNQSTTHAVQARILDFIRKTGSFAAAVSLDPTVWAWKCVVTMNDGATVATQEMPLCEGGVTFQEDPAGHKLGIKFMNHLPIIYT
jgi:hypothetical protein